MVWGLIIGVSGILILSGILQLIPNLLALAFKIVEWFFLGIFFIGKGIFLFFKWVFSIFLNVSKKFEKEDITKLNGLSIVGYDKELDIYKSINKKIYVSPEKISSLTELAFI